MDGELVWMLQTMSQKQHGDRILNRILDARTHRPAWQGARLSSPSLRLLPPHAPQLCLGQPSVQQPPGRKTLPAPRGTQPVVGNRTQKSQDRKRASTGPRCLPERGSTFGQETNDRREISGW